MQAYGPKAIKVYVVDDHDIVRRGLRALMAVKHDIHVVGHSGCAGDAIERIVDLQPDVMVLDLHLQDSSGIHVCGGGRCPGLGVARRRLGLCHQAGRQQRPTDHDPPSGHRPDTHRAPIAQNASGYLLDRVDSGAVQLPPGGRQVLELMLAGHTDSEIATQTGTVTRRHRGGGRRPRRRDGTPGLGLTRSHVQHGASHGRAHGRAR